MGSFSGSFKVCVIIYSTAPAQSLNSRSENNIAASVRASKVSMRLAQPTRLVYIFTGDGGPCVSRLQIEGLADIEIKTVQESSA